MGGIKASLRPYEVDKVSLDIRPNQEGRVQVDRVGSSLDAALGMVMIVVVVVVVVVAWRCVGWQAGLW